MNKYVKEFIHRGLMFSGFGPVVLGIIYLIHSRFNEDFTVSGSEAALAVISVYLLAFVQAGVTVFNQIEHWPISKSLLFHLSTLYVAYSLCYVMNTWIPFEPKVLLIFTIVFLTIYFVVWGIVYLSVKVTSKNCNAKLK